MIFFTEQKPNISLKFSKSFICPFHSLTKTNFIINFKACAGGNPQGWGSSDFFEIVPFRSVLEQGPSARSFRSCYFFSIVLFSFRSFTNRSNIFKNTFYVFVLVGLFLIVPFVLLKEQSFPRGGGGFRVWGEGGSGDQIKISR